MADFRSWLVLGRVSNLSTVWANALCAWMLGGGGEVTDLLVITVGLSLVYVAGMYLNDYCDIKFDIQHRPERLSKTWTERVEAFDFLIERVNG